MSEISLLVKSALLLADDAKGNKIWQYVIYIVLGAVIIVALIIVGVRYLLDRKKKGTESSQSTGFFRDEMPVPDDDEGKILGSEAEEEEDLLLSARLRDCEDEDDCGDKNL